MVYPKDLEAFFEYKAGKYSALLRRVHQHLMQLMPFEVKFQWGGPHYHYKGHILYLNYVGKTDGVYLGLIRGAELSNEDGILVHDCKTAFVRKIYIANHADLDAKREGIRQSIMESILLNETVPSPWKAHLVASRADRANR